MESLRPATILIKLENKIIPKDVLIEALKDTTCGGYAIQDVDKDGNEYIYSERSDEPADADSLTEMMENAKDRKVLIWLGRGKVEPESVQPFIYTVGEEDVMAFALEGDFPGYHHDNGHSDELNLTAEVILPNLARNMKFAGGDSEKFFAELSDETFQKTLLNTAAHRSVFTFMPMIGDIVSAGDNPLGEQYDWGFHSQAKVPAKIEAKKEEPKVEEGPKRGGFLKKAASAVTQAVAPKKEDKPPVIVDQKTETPPKSDTGPTQPQKQWLDIPRNLSKKEKQEFIRKNNGGKLPPGWKAMNKVEVIAKAPVEETKVEAPKPDLKVVGGSKSSVREPYVKDAATKGTDDRAAAVAAEEVNRMVLSKDEKQAGQEFILKHLDYTSKEICPPTEMQRLEQKYGSFSKQLEFDPAEMFKWHPDRVAEFFKRNPKFGLLAFFEMRRRAEVAMADGGKKLGDLTGTETPKEVVAATPSKSGGFLKKKTA